MGREKEIERKLEANGWRRVRVADASLTKVQHAFLMPERWEHDSYEGIFDLYGAMAMEGMHHEELK